MRLNVGVFKPISAGKEGRGEMSFENIKNKGRFIKNSNFGSTGSYKNYISLMETDRNCQKKYLSRLMLKNNVCQQGSHGLAAKTRSWNFSTRVVQTHEMRVFIVLWTGYKLKKSLNLY